MKTILSLALLGLSVSVNAADLASPTLLKPDNNANLPLKKAAKFTWQKVTGATKYQLVLSADKQFSGFDAAKYKCINKTTCFTYTVVSPSYQIAASHAILKTDNNYFWQVQAINKTQRSKTSDVRSFSVGTPTPPAIENVSANPQQITLGNSVTLNAVLDKSLPADNSVKISIDGSDFQNMTGSGTEFSFNFKPAEIGESQFQISIFDKNGVEIDSLGDVFTVIAATATTPDTPAATVTTTAYTKIANDGSTLTDDAQLGSNPKDWACTKDNKTGLIWEVKTSDAASAFDVQSGGVYAGGLRDQRWNYSWYEPDTNKNGGFEGNKNMYSYACKGSECDTYAFTNAVNKQSLCGAKDWRMPTKDELLTIVKLDNLNPFLAIDITFFPNTNSSYWSSSPYVVDGKAAKAAWYIDFSKIEKGIPHFNSTAISMSVRLVRDLNSSTNGTIISNPLPTLISPKITDYVKISNDGSVLSDDAQLGTGSKDWACTKDKKTGLIWEVKTTDGSLHDWTNVYNHYTLEYKLSDFYVNSKKSITSIEGFVLDVNSEGLCGANDWRIPTTDELKGELNGIVKVGGPLALIDTTYFPNTQSSEFWSSTPYASHDGNAWEPVYYHGNLDYKYWGNYSGYVSYVRLVRG